MKRFLKFRYGEKGFTLIELLIVVAILGILAGVLVPNLATFLGTGTVAAANTEAASVETAALAYYADNAGTWPATSDALYTTVLGLNGTGDIDYISDVPEGVYTFDLSTGQISSALAGTWANIQWDPNTNQWIKTP